MKPDKINGTNEIIKQKKSIKINGTNELNILIEI